MAAQTDDKKLDGAGLTTLWGIIKQYIADNPSIPKATASVLGGIMVGTTLAIDNSGVLNLASGIVTAGTYRSVTVDTYGRVTAGSNPNTLAGYGITDAKIDNGAIILGADSITPATQTWVQQQGYTSNIGTVTQVKVGTSAYDPTSGIVSLPAYPTYSAATQSAAGLMSAADKTKLDGIASGANAYTLPVASTSALGGIKVNYTNSGKNYKVQLDSSNNAYVNVPWENTTYTFTNKGATLAWSTTSTIATIGGVDIKVTMPANPDTNTWRTVQCNGTSIGSNTLNLKAGTNVSLSNSNGTITITSTDTNTWRGIQNNLTSTSTSDSLSANQGRLLANGSARDSTKLPLSGGTLTGDLNSNYDVNCNVMRMNYIICGDIVGCFALNSTRITSEKIGNGTYNKMYWQLTGTSYEFEFPKTTDSSSGSNIPIYFGWRGGTYALTLAASTNVGVGTTSPSYKLHVNGACAATSFPNISDMRKKNVIKDGLSIGLNAIANAPLFDYIWKDVSLDKDLHIGSSAQYWKNVIPEAVTTAQDEMCTLSMQYDVIAFASCISVAKETLTLKEKVALLETRIESLEKKIREYESN